MFLCSHIDVFFTTVAFYGFCTVLFDNADTDKTDLVTHRKADNLPCGRLSWLPVSFLLHVKYPLSYRIV